MIHQEVYEPRISDYDQNGLLSLEAILEICENAGNHHSMRANDNVIENSRKGIAWILAEWNVRIKQRPNNGDILTISTWIRNEALSSRVHRDIVILDKDGRESILARATFVLFDLQTQRPVCISPDIIKAYQPESVASLDFNAARLREPQSYETEQHVQLRRTDIDFNGHVHNARYISLALEALPMNIYESDKFSSFRILYRSPLATMSPVTIRSHTTEDGLIIGFYTQDNVLTTLIEFVI